LPDQAQRIAGLMPLFPEHRSGHVDPSTGCRASERVAKWSGQNNVHLRPRLPSTFTPSKHVEPLRLFAGRSQTLEILQRAGEKAHEFNRSELDTEHLLYVLADTDVGTALLKELLLSADDIKGYIDQHAQRGAAQAQASVDQMSISPRLKKVFNFAFQASRDLGHSYVGPEHLLIGLSSVPESIAGTLLKKYGVTPEALRQKVVKVVGKGAEDGRVDTPTGTPTLDKFGRDLTSLAREGKLD
nr:hypothetical protein [Tanacetum cinerariifolium]